jgi:Na+/proline symporter
MVVIAALVALYLPSQIFTRVLFAWVGLGAAFGPLLFAKLLGWQLGAAHQFMGIWIGFSLAVILSWMPNTVGDIAERLMPFALHMLYLILMRKS